ncbi:MAG: DsbA family protein [Pseudomonadota bacterium]
MNLKTRVRSALMNYFSSTAYQQRQQRRGRRTRPKAGAVVHYFHQPDDPYSHLAIQKLDGLRDQYNVGFRVHLVSSADAAFQGSATHYPAWAYRDAQQVADAYDTRFAPSATPTPETTLAAARALSAQVEREDFATQAVEIGTALWGGELNPQAGADLTPFVAGNTLREKLGHYGGAMFYFEGEWYWGLDRSRYLEHRLCAEGFSRTDAIQIPQPQPEGDFGPRARDLTLEYFPSLRSPYTAVGHARVLALIEASGVQLNLRPVMPMMMRGIPAPRAKQRYIITDAGREARTFGVPFSQVVDPFGEPVRRAFALFPGAVALGRGMEFVTSYLHAAWADDTDITKESGLEQVARNAGLEFAELKRAAQGQDWEGLLESNLQAMLAEDLWGVPSFKVTGGDRPDFACWGQDRIWRVAQEIIDRSGA